MNHSNACNKQMEDTEEQGYQRKNTRLRKLFRDLVKCDSTQLEYKLTLSSACLSSYQGFYLKSNTCMSASVTFSPNVYFYYMLSLPQLILTETSYDTSRKFQDVRKKSGNLLFVFSHHCFLAFVYLHWFAFGSCYMSVSRKTDGVMYLFQASVVFYRCTVSGMQ